MRNKIILVVILAISMLNLSGCFKSDIDDYLATIKELKTEAEKLSDNLEVLTTKDELFISTIMIMIMQFNLMRMGSINRNILKIVNMTTR